MRKGELGAWKTRFEDQWEIVREYGWRSFPDVEEELREWVDDRAWTTGDGTKMIEDAPSFDRGKLGVFLIIRYLASRVCGDRPGVLASIAVAWPVLWPRRV